MEDFHDATIKALQIEFIEGSAIIELQRYDQKVGQLRDVARIVSQGLSDFSSTISLEDLNEHKLSGNVSWLKHEEGGLEVTLYLVGGTIKFCATAVEITEF